MPIVQTRPGALEGVEHPGAVSFLGIPYAAAPVGTRRWLPPAPPAPWAGTLDATKHPNRAYQVPFPEELAPPGGIPGELSEDMLYLNIRRQPDASGCPARPRPPHEQLWVRGPCRAAMRP